LRFSQRWGWWWPSGFWCCVYSSVDASINKSTWHQNPEEHYHHRHQSSSVFNNKLYFCNPAEEFQNFEITPKRYHLTVLRFI
jgi:hypothetical protein